MQSISIVLVCRLPTACGEKSAGFLKKFNEAWEDLKSESHENIESEKGIVNRRIRSIQTEGHFVDIKENDQFWRLHYPIAPSLIL